MLTTQSGSTDRCGARLGALTRSKKPCDGSGYFQPAAVASCDVITSSMPLAIRPGDQRHLAGSGESPSEQGSSPTGRTGHQATTVDVCPGRPPLAVCCQVASQVSAPGHRFVHPVQRGQCRRVPRGTNRLRCGRYRCHSSYQKPAQLCKLGICSLTTAAGQPQQPWSDCRCQLVGHHCGHFAAAKCCPDGHFAPSAQPRLPACAC